MNQNNKPETAQEISDIDQYLNDIIINDPTSIKASVAKEALDYYDIPSFFTDILQHGCKSGIISGLIYYSDTHAFFDKHYAAIEQIREDIETNLGEPLTTSGDLKNYMAWMAFEETAFQMALGLYLIV